MNLIEGKYYDFETEYDIWGFKSVNIGININIDDDYNIDEYKDRIAKTLEWVNRKRHVIEQAILDNNMTESAEFWIQDAERLENGCYLLEDGSSVSLPLSDDDFCMSLRLSELLINFEEDGSSDMEIYFICKPDYFAGHCIEITVDNDKNISCDGVSG